MLRGLSPEKCRTSLMIFFSLENKIQPPKERFLMISKYGKVTLRKKALPGPSFTRKVLNCSAFGKISPGRNKKVK